MQLRIVAVGRLKSGPQKTIYEEYIARAQQLGRRQGISGPETLEIDERKHRTKQSQASAILGHVPQETFLVALDERGKQYRSPQFSDLLGTKRDAGLTSVIFAIGGADGHHQDVLERADAKLSFGQMVWPHMLVRIMLAEQIFRAQSILANTPYHRE